MSSTRSVISPGVFASDASTVIPPTPIQGVSYRDPLGGPASAPDGWPFFEKVNSADFNQLMFQYSSLLDIIDKQGILGWSDLVDYAVPAIVFGSNGILYFAIQANGPGLSLVRDPITSVNFWQPLSGHGQVTFTTPGVTNWTVPMAMQLGIIKPQVEVVSGGAGGGRLTVVGAGGGGGGARSIGTVDLTGVSSVTITVGAGSPGILSPVEANASNGGASSFGTYMSCTGGLAAVGSAAGQSGTASGGEINQGLGDGSSSYVGGGGSTSGGNGGGPGGAGTLNGGRSAVGYGGGGGGAVSLNGGNGRGGYVRITW